MKRLSMKLLCSKGTLLAFALLYSFFAVIGSTYSWITSADTRPNEFSGEERLETILFDVFIPDMGWKPGNGIAKEVRAYNSGTAGMVVRIFFEEALKKPNQLTPFTDPDDSDMILPEYCRASGWADAAVVFGGGIDLPPGVPSGLTIKARPLKTLVDGGNRYEYIAYYDLGGGKSQRVTASFEPRNSPGGEVLAVSNIQYWGYKGYTTPLTAKWWEGLPDTSIGEARDINQLVADAGKMIAIDYNSADLDDTSPTAGKWYYSQEDGYFYYIGKLAPGEFTPSLLESLSLDEDAPVAYSALRLDLTVHLESVSSAALALGEWSLGPGDAVYDALLTCGAFA